MLQNYPLRRPWPTRPLALAALLLLAALLAPAALRAQTYQLPYSGTTTITTCAGTLYDNGGASGPYSPNADGSVTIVPATAGNKVRLQFTTVDLEAYFDHLYVYDGPSTAAPLLGDYGPANPPGTLYGSSASGALTVRLTSDGSAQYAGFAAAIGCVAALPPPAQPDLLVQTPQFYPPSVLPGGVINTGNTVLNQSGSTAAGSNTGYYLSANPVLDAGDVLLGSTAGGPLLVGQSSGHYTTLTIPAGTTPGSYYVLFVADPTNAVAESNETNNVSPLPLTVQAPGYDLLIQQPSVYPGNVAPGVPLTLSCYINNLGNSTAPGSSVGFYLSNNATLDAADQLLTSQSGGALYPNYASSRFGSVPVPTGLAPGTYYILFVADYQNQVPETNEANNVSAVSFTVSPPGVDLVIQQEQLYPATAVPGDVLQLTCVVTNQGNVAATSSTAGFYLSANATFDAADVLLSTSVGYPLPGYQGSTRYANPTVPAGTAPGSYYVLFVADPANAVAETSETNNVRSLVLTVQAPTVDLSTGSAYLSPGSVVPGSSTQASSYLTNAGNAPAAPATVGYYLSANATLDAADVLLGTTTGYLGGGSSATRYAQLTIPAGTALGSYYVLFVADHLNQVAETNETNNLTAAPLQVVGPVVDLLPSPPYLSAGLSAPGGQVGASCSLLNQGNSTAASSTLGYYLSTNTTFDAADVLLLTDPAGPLFAGSYAYRTAQLTIPAGTTLGSYYVLCVADPANAVAESSETNNVTAAALQVVAPVVDLRASQAYLSPAVSAAGNTVGASCLIENLGNSLAVSSTLGYYLSTDQTLDAADVLLLSTVGGGLPGGGFSYRNASLLIPAGTAAGSYHVLMAADPANAVAEADEANNLASAPLLLLAPGVDLQPLQPQLGAAAATPGYGIQATCGIANNGTSTAPGSTLGYYLSADPAFDAADVLLTTVPGSALGAGQTTARPATLVVPIGTAAGTYYVLFVADPANAVAETNEANNVASQPLTVNPPFSGNVVPVGGTATVTSCSTVIYDNGGLSNYADNASGALTLLPATAGALVQLTFTEFATEAGYDFVRVYDGPTAGAPLLGTFSGSQLPLPLTATNTAGALTVTFVSDGYVNGPGFQATVSCVSAPQSDLLLTQIGASPSTVPAGNAVVLSAEVANQGGGPAPASAVGYYLSTDQVLSAADVPLGTSPGAALGLGQAAGRTLAATVPATTAPGAYYVLFVADPANAVAETNEANNTAALRFTVTRATPTRDQAAGYTVAVAPNPVAAGQPLLVQLAGPGPAGTATLELYNALGQRVHSQPLLLGAGRANRAEVPTQALASGVYTLRLLGAGLRITRRVLIN